MNKLQTIIFNWYISLQPPCTVISDHLSEAEDHKLSFKDWLWVKIHLKTCTWCTHYGHQIKFINQALQRKAEAVTKESSQKTTLSEASKAKIKQALKDQSND